MARVRVPISDEDINAALSQKAAKILGEEEPKPMSSPKQSFKIPRGLLPKLAIGAVALLFIFGFVILIKDRNKLQGQVDQLSGPTQSQDETQQLIDHIGQFMELPSGETPTLATVENVEELKSQAFFKNAQNDDKVLLYAKSGKAILYRPSSKKVIEVSPIDTNSANTLRQSKNP